MAMDKAVKNWCNKLVFAGDSKEYHNEDSI